MPISSKIVIADTSCFILLKKIDELDLLMQIFTQVLTTPEIVEEFGEELPDWILVQTVKDKKFQTALALQVDGGEASAIALGAETENALLVLDDLLARKLAERLNLAHTGTLGIIAAAKRNGIIKSVKPVITKIRQTNFRFSEDVYLAILKASGELDE